MGEVFRLKFRDTRPALEVTLHDPAPAGSAPAALGPVHDLAGATGVKLHVYLSTGAVVSRDMTIDANPATGVARYTWQATDWDAGGLVAGPTLPLRPGEREHRMEYEVLGPGGARLTFPNDDWDTLRIVADIGQG